jgi:hypothetical protein
LPVHRDDRRRPCLYGRLIAAVNFDDPDRTDDGASRPSYLLAVTGYGDDSGYPARAVEHALEFVGATVARLGVWEVRAHDPRDRQAHRS